jgi:iron complex transport system substrate-binding protein
VAGGQHGGLATISMEQILAWDPEEIVTIDPDFARNAPTDPDWRSVAAVRAGRVHLSPRLPFGWIYSPPSVNRLIGHWWLGKVLYPASFSEDLRPMIRDFYHRIRFSQGAEW